MKLLKSPYGEPGTDINESLPAGVVTPAIIKVSHNPAEAPVGAHVCQDGTHGDPDFYCNHTNENSFLPNGSFMLISHNAPGHNQRCDNSRSCHVQR